MGTRPLELARNGGGVSEAQREALRRRFREMMSVLHSEEGASLRMEILDRPEVEGFIDTHAGILDSSFDRVDMSDSMR